MGVRRTQRGHHQRRHRRRPAPTGGADRDRTDDLRLAKPALSQLSYSPEDKRTMASSIRTQKAARTARTRRSTLRGRRPAANATAANAAESNVNAWARADLNCRPHAYQACALTT